MKHIEEKVAIVGLTSTQVQTRKLTNNRLQPAGEPISHGCLSIEGEIQLPVPTEG